MKKKIKIILGIIIISLLMIGCFVLGQNINKDDTIKIDDLFPDEALNEVSENTANNDENTPNSEKNELGVNVNITAVNSWEQEEGKYTNFKIDISNLKDKIIDDWELKIAFNEKIDKISDSWNGNFSVDGNSLSIKAVDFNEKIPIEQDVSIGGIFISKKVLKVESYDFLSKGKSILVKDDDEINKENTENIQNENQNNESENNMENKIKDDYVVEQDDKSPVALHGKLSVKNGKIVDEKGKKVQLQGISTHSIYEFGDYVNYESFKSLKKDLNCNVVRLAMYSAPELGYTPSLHEKVASGVKYATENGLYVIIDWHILSDYNPNMNIENAKIFFTEMSEQFKDYNNVMYEICNEPNGDTKWDDVKQYAHEIIPIIRERSPESIIIVGTPFYCQDVDIASESPLTEYDNLLYSLHFYAASHKDALRAKLDEALKNDLPIIVSEFGISEASGNGNIDEIEANKWIDLLREKNIGYICWNLSNKDESSALLNSGCQKYSDYQDEDLSDEGKWLKAKFCEI